MNESDQKSKPLPFYDESHENRPYLLESWPVMMVVIGKKISKRTYSRGALWKIFTGGAVPIR